MKENQGKNYTRKNIEDGKVKKKPGLRKRLEISKRKYDRLDNSINNKKKRIASLISKYNEQSKKGFKDPELLMQIEDGREELQTMTQKMNELKGRIKALRVMLVSKISLIIVAGAVAGSIAMSAADKLNDKKADDYNVKGTEAVQVVNSRFSDGKEFSTDIENITPKEKTELALRLLKVQIADYIGEKDPSKIKIHGGDNYIPDGSGSIYSSERVGIIGEDGQETTLWSGTSTTNANNTGVGNKSDSTFPVSKKGNKLFVSAIHAIVDAQKASGEFNQKEAAQRALNTVIDGKEDIPQKDDNPVQEDDLELI